MAKFACPKCKTPISVSPDELVVECPNCGQKCKNPTYQAPVEEETPIVEPEVEESVVEDEAPVEEVEAPVEEEQAAPAQEEGMSYFTASMISWLGHHLFNFLLTLITLGFAYPWVRCREYRWEISHKVIDGKMLVFEGKGISLLGHWIVWMLLTLITIGIYGLWVPCKMQAWITERTHIRAEGEIPAKLEQKANKVKAKKQKKAKK